MPLSIKSQPVEDLARKIAALTGETLTEAIRSALSDRYDRLHRASGSRSIVEELNTIGLRCASRPVVSQMTDDEILGYDSQGIPTR